MMRSLFSATLLGLVFFPGLTCADDKFYRYKDEHGQIVIDTAVPADRVPFGYEVLNETGRVIETVSRKLTAEEIAVVDQQREQEKQRAKQREYDIKLLQKYSFVGDIEAEKKRKLQEMSVRATILKGNLNSVRGELEVEYARAAKAERRGHKVSDKVQARIQQLEEKITTTEELLEKQLADVQQTRLEYLRAIERFKELKALRGQ